MKKAVLIIAIIITLIFFSWYIIEPRGVDQWIGRQDDNSQELLAAEYAAASSEIINTRADGNNAQQPPLEHTSISQSGGAVPQSPEQNGWNLIWSDEFDAPFLNMEYWTEDDRRENFNEELQYYLPANSYIEDGCLTLTAKQEEMDGRSYTSGMVETRDKLAVLYGRIEARISLPVSQGIFPAFWMLSNSGYHELDILEMIGSEPGTIYGVCHCMEQCVWKAYGYTTVEDPEAFHVYAIEWDKDEVRWYVDNIQYFSTRNYVPDEQMYIILTLAVGGVWPGNPDATTQFPMSIKIDYIHVYNRETEDGS